MTKNILEELFGSKDRWRMIKIFLLNEDDKLGSQEISKKTKINGNKTRSLLNQFKKLGFLFERKSKGRKVYLLNKNFPFFDELKVLVTRSNVFPQCESLGSIAEIGDVRLCLISGVFANHPRSKTDILIVGENISAVKLKKFLENLEAEIGKEVNYSIMDLNEFRYRINMFDRFIMESFESPHDLIINKVSKEIQQLKNAKKLF